MAGRAILFAAPWLMKALSVAGTAAMFLVGGGILVHGLTPLRHLYEAAAQLAGGMAGVADALAFVTPLLIDLLVGLLAGALALAAVAFVGKATARRAVPQ